MRVARQRETRLRDLTLQRTNVSEAALFLDLDGTLAPFAPRPQDVGPDPARTALLRALDAALGGRLAVISGRAIAEIDRILEGAVQNAAGVHGLEVRRHGGRVEQSEPAPALAETQTAFEAYARERRGVLVEGKRLSVALHYRGAPEFEAEVRALAERLAEATGLRLQMGAMVAELRTPGPDKGDMVRSFMAAAPFRGVRPIFIGDDVTDEDGFEAAAALGGCGVLVGAERRSAAQARLPDPPAVLAWLSASRDRGAFVLEDAPWAA